MKRFAAAAAFAENPLTHADDRDFAAILGASPSRGARSPVLWNAAFAAHGLDARMLPIDVAGARLEPLLEELDSNPRFLGGAVTTPHKEAIAHWLGDRLTVEARAIGAINCLFRGQDGRLHGTNTDGEGALRSFESRCGLLRGKTVLLLGVGGAGKAVAAFFRGAVEPHGCLKLCGRSQAAQIVASRLRARSLEWSDVDSALAEVDVLVNCTSVGAADQVGRSPMSAEQLAKLPSHTVVFDIIYQPSPSALLALAQSRGLQTLDGGQMNLEQAVLAYGYAASAPCGTDTTRAAMTDARKRFD
jgi:shikimate dehydrogenase